jgi:hypothetical protein
MEMVKKLPPTPSGHVDMTAHYSAYRRAADCIAAQIIVRLINRERVEIL